MTVAKFAGFFLIAIFASRALAEGDAQNCSASATDRIRGWALALDPRADEEGPAYLKACPASRDEVLLWLTYYYRARGQYDKAAQLTQPLQGGNTGSERDRVLGDALTKDSSELEAKVRSGDSAYADDAEALLILSRSLAREKKFSDARTYYAEYLKKKPDDRDIAIEQAYTYLWEGNGEKAEKALRDLKSAPGLTESQSQAVEAGLAQSGRVEAPSQRPIALEPPAVSLLGGTTTTTFFGFSKTATGLGYQGENVNAAAQNLWLNSSRDGTSKYTALEGTVGGATTVDRDLSLSAKVGGFKAEQSVFIYQAFAELRLADGATPYVGAYQGALAEDVPLPQSLTGTARSAQLIGVRFRDYIDARAENRDFHGLTHSTYISGLLQVPLKDLEGVGAAHGGLKAFFHAENESFGTASQYLYSPQSSTALRLGLRYSADITPLFSGRVGFSYGTNLETSQAGSGLTYGSSASLVGVEGDFGYLFSKRTQAILRFSSDRTGGDQGTTYSATSFLFGLTFNLDAGERNTP